MQPTLTPYIYIHVTDTTSAFVSSLVKDKARLYKAHCNLSYTITMRYVSCDSWNLLIERRVKGVEQGRIHEQHD